MFDIRSTYGGDSPTGMYPGLSEVGFEGVPEPSTLAMLFFALVCGSASSEVDGSRRKYH